MLQIDIEKLPSFIMGYEKGLKMAMEICMKADEEKEVLIIAERLIKKGLSLEEIARM